MKIIDTAPAGRKRNLTPLTDEQQRLVEEHIGFARWKLYDRSGRLASRPKQRGRADHFESRDDDIHSEAMDALINAARLFKPELGFKFETYAGTAIDNAVGKSLGWGSNKPLDRQFNKSLDCGIWDSQAQKHRPLYDVVADDREEDDPAPTLSTADLEMMKTELFDREYQVVVERLGGATQAEIGRKLGLTAQRISQIQAEATAKIKRAIEKRDRIPTPQERRHEAMGWAKLACSARQHRIADGDPNQKRAVETREEFQERRLLYWGIGHDVNKCPACNRLKALGVSHPELWAGQMAGASAAARQANRRLLIEWANYDINPLTGVRCSPTRKLSRFKRPKAADWYVEDRFATPAPHPFDEGADVDGDTPEIDAADIDGRKRKLLEGFDGRDIGEQTQVSMTKSARLRRVLKQYGVDGSVPFEEAVARVWSPEPPPTFVCDIRLNYKICRRPEPAPKTPTADLRRAA